MTDQKKQRLKDMWFVLAEMNTEKKRGIYIRELFKATKNRYDWCDKITGSTFKNYLWFGISKFWVFDEVYKVDRKTNVMKTEYVYYALTNE